MKRDAKGTGWSLIPPHILADKDLTSTQKILWGKINALADREGHCWASNEWLAKSLDKTKRTISKSVSDLVDKGFLSRELDRNGKGEVAKRKLYPKYPSPGVTHSTSGGGEENFEYKNRSLSKDVNNNNGEDETDDTLTEDIEEVFEYWRNLREEKLGLDHKGPRMKLTGKRKSKIRARLREGYTVEMLKNAVDGMLGSDFHINNGHTDIELACRNQTKVEQFRAWANKEEEKTRAQERESQDDVREVDISLDTWEPDD